MQPYFSYNFLLFILRQAIDTIFIEFNWLENQIVAVFQYNFQYNSVCFILYYYSILFQQRILKNFCFSKAFTIFIFIKRRRPAESLAQININNVYKTRWSFKYPIEESNRITGRTKTAIKRIKMEKFTERTTK